MSVYGEFTRLLTSRRFRREKEKAQKPPPARTQRVHTKDFVGPKRAWTMAPGRTNPLAGFRLSKQSQFELEQAVRREVRDFHFRKWN